MRFGIGERGKVSQPLIGKRVRDNLNWIRAIERLVWSVAVEPSENSNHRFRLEAVLHTLLGDGCFRPESLPDSIGLTNQELICRIDEFNYLEGQTSLIIGSAGMLGASRLQPVPAHPCAVDQDYKGWLPSRYAITQTVGFAHHLRASSEPRSRTRTSPAQSRHSPSMTKMEVLRDRARRSKPRRN